MSVTKPALRYHGSKFRLAPWLFSFFPEHVSYVEPFGGAASVLLQKPRSYAEIYNDLDGDVVNFFRVIRDPALRAALIDSCIFTPYAREEFELAWTACDDPVERARRTAIRAQMGFGSAGATKGVTGFRIDTKRAYGTAQHEWSRYPEAIAAAGQRLQGVLIENRPAISVMQQHDGSDTLHFVDPPYMFRTRDKRAATHGYYKHEMDDEAHAELLQSLRKLEGFVVLCGYHTDFYDSALVGWQRHQVKARISAGRGTALRTEVVWLNPACAEAVQSQNSQQVMFS